MGSMDRHRERIAALLAAPMEGEHVVGAAKTTGAINQGLKFTPGFNLASSLKMPDVSFMDTPSPIDSGLAAGSSSTTASDAAAAEDAARLAEQKAASAGAEATTELDQFGPLHREALNTSNAAKAARAKANYYKGSSAPIDTGIIAEPRRGTLYPAPPPGMPVQTPPSNFTRNALILGGVAVLGLGALFLIRRND